jgi:hypothetical protein
MSCHLLQNVGKRNAGRPVCRRANSGRAEQESHLLAFLQPLLGAEQTSQGLPFVIACFITFWALLAVPVLALKSRRFLITLIT